MTLVLNLFYVVALNRNNFTCRKVMEHAALYAKLTALIVNISESSTLQGSNLPTEEPNQPIAGLNRQTKT